MFSAGNPYHIAGPIEDETLFVGRREVIAWVWQTLALDEPLLVITGPPLIGKSSVLLQLEREASEEHLAVYVDLSAARSLGEESLSTFVIDRAHRALLTSANEEDEQIAPTAPASVWKALRDLSPAKRPLLLLDNLDFLLADIDAAGWTFLDDLAELMTMHPDIQIVCAARSLERLRRINQLPFFRAPWRKLEPFSRTEAIRLIKRPTEGILEFDFDAIARIDELTGRLPYFIQLLCGQIYELKPDATHVTMVDVEPAIRALGEAPMAQFQAAWDNASPEGKLILSLLGSLKGAYEVFTQAEISTGLRAHGIQANLTDINLVLAELAKDNALYQLGSQSYRLSVELFRYWLRGQYPVEEAVTIYRWQPGRRRSPRPAAGKGQRPASRSTKLTLAVIVPLATLVIAVGLIFGLQRQDEPPQPSATPTSGLATMAAVLLAPTDTPSPKPPTPDKSRPAADISTQSTSTPIPTEIVPTATDAITPTATATATPTKPAIIARSMPAIAYMHKAGKEHWQIWLMGADGSSPIALTEGSTDDTAPAWSPEGLRLAFVAEGDGNKEIYTMGIDGSNRTNLTNHEADDWTPAWSPDGTELAFSSMRDGNWEIYLMWSDGADPIRLTDDPDSDFAPTWAPDGESIAFASKRDGDWDIYVMDRGGKNLRKLTDAAGSDLSPAWSPDGKYIAFESNRDGNTEIYRMLADGGDQINLSQTPSANDHWPTWSPDSSRLAFCSNRDGSWNVYVMSIDGKGIANLTNDDDNSQGPAWRP